jgi:hypothetical protein
LPGGLGLAFKLVGRGLGAKRGRSGIRGVSVERPVLGTSLLDANSAIQGQDVR